VRIQQVGVVYAAPLVHVVVVVVVPQELMQSDVVLYRQKVLNPMYILQAELICQLAFDILSPVSIEAHPQFLFGGSSKVRFTHWRHGPLDIQGYNQIVVSLPRVVESAHFAAQAVGSRQLILLVKLAYCSEGHSFSEMLHYSHISGIRRTMFLHVSEAC